MKTIVFFLEEPSAREMLEGVLPRLLPPDITPRYLVFQGKQDLERNLVKKLRGWKMPRSVFVVMRDQDSGDCVAVKHKLVELCRQGGRDDVLVRVACRELESFYLGDLHAVEAGLGLKGIAVQQERKKFRRPDFLGNPSEELYKLTNDEYEKVLGSRAIAPYLKLIGNRSQSFNVLLSGIQKLVGTEA